MRNPHLKVVLQKTSPKGRNIKNRFCGKGKGRVNNIRLIKQEYRNQPKGGAGPGCITLSQKGKQKEQQGKIQSDKEKKVRKQAEQELLAIFPP